jgi:copper(I)-binding protein
MHAPGIAPLALVALLLSTSAGIATAHDKRQGDLHIGHPWAKPAPAGGPAEVYFGIINRGASPDRLIGADAAVAESAILAETVDGIAEPRAAIELNPSRPVPLRPGRLHIRLDGLKRPLREGEEFPVTLRFAVSQPVEITVLVEAAAGH